MYDFDSAMRAYHEDAAFRTLVSTLEAAIHSLQISPADLRAACMFACLRYEQFNGRPTLALTAQEAERLGLRITKP
jgi:hypothetical protein